MGRSRTATQLLEMRGAFAKNPQRARPNEPTPATGFPEDPPENLSPGVQACWRQIADIAPPGVLTGSDVVVVELIAQLLYEFRDDPQGMPVSRMTQLRTMLGRIGLDPSGRAGLVVPKAPEGGAFERFRN